MIRLQKLSTLPSGPQRSICDLLNGTDGLIQSARPLSDSFGYLMPDNGQTVKLLHRVLQLPMLLILLCDRKDVNFGRRVFSALV